MKKALLFLILGSLIVGLIYGAYWYTKEHLNPSWERRAGLVADHSSSFNKADIINSYTCSSQTGTVRLVLSKKKAYEIYLKRANQDYLYSKGTWKKKVDESVFPERISYLLKSEPLPGPVGEFRFHFHEMKGLFFDPQKDNAPIKYLVHFPKETEVYETWEFRIQKEHLLDLKTNKTFKKKGKKVKTKKGEQSKDKKKPKVSASPNDSPIAKDNSDTKPSNVKSSDNNNTTLSNKERHQKANVRPTSIQKIKPKIESVYDCKGCYGAMTVRLVILRGMEFQIHVIEGEDEYLYSEGVYSGGRTLGLNAEEIKQEYAAYRLEKHPYHGTFVNDTGSEDGMKAIRKVKEVWNAKYIFETWMFRKTDKGNMLDVNDKKTFVYNKDLSKWNMAALSK